MCTAGNDGVIQIWKCEEKDAKLTVKKEKEITTHTKAITHMDISIDDAMVRILSLLEKVSYALHQKIKLAEFSISSQEPC